MRLVEGPCKFGGCLCQILPVTCEHSCWRDITSRQLEEGREGEGRGGEGSETKDEDP